MCHKIIYKYITIYNKSFNLHNYVYKLCSSFCGSVLQESVTTSTVVFKNTLFISYDKLLLWQAALNVLHYWYTQYKHYMFYVNNEFIYSYFFFVLNVGYFISLITVPADSMDSAIMQFICTPIAWSFVHKNN